MSGQEIIDAAVEVCVYSGNPPNDAHILQVIRDRGDIDYLIRTARTIQYMKRESAKARG